METNQNTSLFQLNLDAQNSYTLRSAATWSKVLGVVGIILGILFIVFGITIQQYLNGGRYGYRSRDSGAFAGLGMAIYFVMGVIMIISSVFALNASNKINLALRSNDQAALSGGFAGIRNYFAIWAIVIMVMVALLFISFTALIGR